MPMPSGEIEAFFRDRVISSDGVAYVDASHTFSGSS
jgi:hypothetical protein